MSEPRRTISPGRQGIYYVGMLLMVVGFLTFGSVFVSFAMHFGDFNNFEAQARSAMARGVIGMGILIFGGILSGIGRAGLAGSGVVLDPQQARQDIEPWNRAAGGMLNDALEEAPALKEIIGGASVEQVVKVKCGNCEALNDEHARFCNRCGKSL